MEFSRGVCSASNKAQKCPRLFTNQAVIYIVERFFLNRLLYRLTAFIYGTTDNNLVISAICYQQINLSLFLRYVDVESIEFVSTVWCCLFTVLSGQLRILLHHPYNLRFSFI